MKESYKHAINIALLIIISLIFFRPWLNIYEHHSGDIVIHYLPRTEFLKQSIIEYNDFMPLWIPYSMGGTTYVGKTVSPSFNYILGPLILTMPTTLGAIKYSFILGIILAGIFMYILMNYLFKNKTAALLSAIIYMFNGYILENIIHAGWMVFAHTYQLIPLMIYFSFKAFNTKKCVLYSILAGITFAFMIHAGSGIIFLYSTQLFGIFLIYKLFGKNFKKRLVKVVIIGVIVLIVAYGLAAFKVLPVQEYMEVSSRKFSYQQSSTRPETLDHIIPSMTNIIGIGALILVIIALISKWNNKTVLFLLAVMIFGILVSMRGPLLYLIWKYYPAWKGMRYASRGMLLFTFAASMLAGVGLIESVKKIKTKVKWIKPIIILGSIIILVTVNLLVFGIGPTRRGVGNQYEFRNIDEMIKENNIMQAISQKPGIFRMHVFETRGIDEGTEFYTLPLKLEPIFGYENSWLQEYMNEYLSIAWNNPAKFWGILNVRYMTSKEKLNMTGFKFLKEYEKCDICFPTIPKLAKAYGPYLYENEMFLPRAFIVDNSILVVGEKQSSKQTMYGLILNENFNPENTVIILGDKERINDYSGDFLSKFDFIILTKNSIDQNSNFILQSYMNKGGKILPNILENKNSVSEEELKVMFDSFKGTLAPIDDDNIVTLNFDEKEIDLGDKKTGFLVLSEKYPMFPGWRVIVDGKEGKLLRADGVITAVHLDDKSNLLFQYKPKSLKNGFIITITTILAVFSYFIYIIIRKFKTANKPPQ